MSPEENGLTFEAMDSLVQGYFPGSEVEVAAPWGLDLPFHRRLVVFSRSESHYFEDFETVHMNKQQDPLSVVVQTMDTLQEGEELVYSVHVFSLRHHSQQEVEELLQISAYDAGQRVVFSHQYRPGLAESVILQDCARLFSTRG